jgi:hypothetical protein
MSFVPHCTECKEAFCACCSIARKNRGLEERTIGEELAATLTLGPFLKVPAWKQEFKWPIYHMEDFMKHVDGTQFWLTRSGKELPDSEAESPQQ